MNAAPLSVAFSPRVRAVDPLAASWLSEATLCLRREIAWLQHQRRDARTPARGEPLSDSLNLTRFEEDKRHFLANDVTARYLSEQIEELQNSRMIAAGPWRRLVDRLSLDDGAQFVLALGLLAFADPASGVVLAACHDTARTAPTLALAHRLCAADVTAHTARSLFHCGVLVTAGEIGASAGWHQPYELTALIGEAILRDDGRLPPEMRLPPTKGDTLEGADAIRYAARLRREAPRAVEIVPLLGDHGCDFVAWAAHLARLQRRTLVLLTDDTLPEPARLSAIAAWCWLYDADVLLPLQQRGGERAGVWPQIPVRWLAPAHDASALSALPGTLIKTPIQLPPTGFQTRVARFRQALGRPHASELDSVIEEMARRFRLSPVAMDAIGTAVKDGSPLDADTLHALCRAQSHALLGGLAQRVEPRFELKQLVLPEVQSAQIAEIVQAMRSLTRVHYHWGTARAWNEAGLSVVFCGPPGTGKTMAAEALAHELQLPIFRIDLSQVVNKYIGETEKNLARVFDAAEDSDCVMFFDEADALFGKRMNVKDAHDRFANIEVSYLLERMERLKGVAVLATNRRKDLDEAFLRRVRYLVEFPMPGEREREQLWRDVFPPGVDTSALDFASLARLFPLAGGHIRSIAFNACLQAARKQEPAIDMPPVLFAVKRELDKLDRPSSPDSFGPYAAVVRPLFLAEDFA